MSEPPPDSAGDLRERLSRISRARPAGEVAGDKRRDAEDEPCRARLAPRRLEDYLPGEEITGERGVFWFGRWEFDDRAIEAAEVLIELDAWMRSGERTPLLLLDLETTGFSGTPLFLAGIVEVDAAARPPKIAQLFARDYSEEAAVIEAIAARLALRPTLVTFNGKSYDMPFLRDRAACHRIPLPEPADHVDLLHAARRRWRDVLPDCRLQTLEAHLGGGYGRVGDVPGAEIPGRYHDAVRRGDPSGLFGVFLHNALDLVTLARLYVELMGEETRG